MREFVPIRSVNLKKFSVKGTGLSRDLSVGGIDPRDILREINAKLDLKLSRSEHAYLEAVKERLILREYARSALPHAEYLDLPDPRPAVDPMFNALKSGCTGIPIIDAAVRDLEAGYPHDGARRLLAMFATRTLNLSPRVVVAWFREHLRDFSPILCYFNVYLAAGVISIGNRLVMRFDPYAEGRKYDPEHRYLKLHDIKPRTRATPTHAKLIRDGMNCWLKRWGKTAATRNPRKWKPLWPLDEPDHGRYFILDRLGTVGRFKYFYRKYLKNENRLLESE